MVEWTDDNTFVIGGIDYVCKPMLLGGFPSEPGRFCLVKPTSAVRAYEQLLAARAPNVVVEVGIHDGASTALIAELARPDRLVAIDRRPTGSRALDDFVARRGFAEVVSTHYGVDQGDAPRLRKILDAELGDQPIDLVVDDASHLLDLTRRTFNALFPSMRPGGAYVIEDWWWAHAGAAEALLPDETPMTVLVLELVLACASAPGIVASVTANREWTLVERGDAEIDADTFDISACYGPRARGLLTTR
jgi:predicted O-methyltransferase YrrM